MFARYLNAPLLLLLWQIAPVDLPRDASGRVRVSFGVGGGSFAFVDYPGSSPTECYGGSPPSTEVLPYSSRAVAAEVWATDRVRLLGAFGGVTDYSGERQGAFGGILGVFEQKYFGVGLGLAGFGGTQHGLQPAGSLRVGPLDHFSLRADYLRPDGGLGLLGAPRIGVGWNQGRSDKLKFFLGMATTPVPDSARRVGGLVELALPLGFLGRKAGFSFTGFWSGHYHGYEEKRIRSLDFGFWIQP